MKGIILAGGSGTRLWPLSRSEKPKQFLNLLGKYSLLQLTALRIKNYIFADPIIIAGGGYNHGKFIAYGRQDHPPLSNLFLSTLNNIGIDIPVFGASTGILDWG